MSLWELLNQKKVKNQRQGSTRFGVSGRSGTRHVERLFNIHQHGKPKHVERNGMDVILGNAGKNIKISKATVMQQHSNNSSCFNPIIMKPATALGH